MADEQLRKIFAENLKQQLLAHDKTQADLARYLNVSTATTANWCSGKIMPRVDKIQSICNWMIIEKSDLLDKPSVRAEKPLSAVTDDEKHVLEAYRSASSEIQTAVCAVLGVKREENSQDILDA